MGGGDLSFAATIPCDAVPTDEFFCTICLEKFFEQSCAPCGHYCCKNCLQSAIQRSNQCCPICKHMISKGEPTTVNLVVSVNINNIVEAVKLLFAPKAEAGNKIDTSKSGESKRDEWIVARATLVGAMSGMMVGMMLRK